VCSHSSAQSRVNLRFARQRVIGKKAHYTRAKAVFLRGLHAFDFELEERQPHGEELFDFPYPGFIDQEHDYMIIRLHSQMVVGDQYFVMADDRTDGRALGQVDFIQPPANDFGGFVITVGNGFDSLSSASAQ
jgi:hypothetical protein